MAGVAIGAEAKLGKRFAGELRSRGEMEANSVRHSRKWYLVRTDAGFKYGYGILFYVWIVLSAVTSFCVGRLGKRI
jgi:hypothetical protein